ncbi:MAG: oxidoreductase [bacterium]|nr:oxidoreductase [bacterium]
MGKVVLITGASAGIGREAAILMAKTGHTVYAGARRADRLAELAEHGITPVEMDVSEGDDNERAVDRVIAAEGRIDVLINNAGFGLNGPVEDIPIDDARYQFEVNLFGLAQLTQLVLPHMRAQGSGRIVNVSSVVGRVFLPLGAWYNATKHALEGWSDCLRYETAPFGIQVVVIQPGAIRTEFGDVAWTGMEKHVDDTAYGAVVEPFRRLRANPRLKGRSTDAAVVAKVYLMAATARRPRRRYVTGAFARPAMFLRKWFGDGVYEFALRRVAR